MGAVRVKRVYDPPDPGEGLRVLVTTYWPRGLRKDGVDRWFKALGTDPELLRPWLDGAIDREAFRQSYRQQLERPEGQAALEELAAIAAGQDVVLLTSIKDLSRSHAWFLKELLEERLAGQ